MRGYETRYLINRHGEVRSVRGLNRPLLKYQETVRILTVLLTGDCGERKRIGVHELIAQAFRGPKNYGAIVMARDGNLKNCTPENIYYDDEDEEAA